jgi:hypothetical protein
MTIKVAIVLSVVLISVAHADPIWIGGSYRNPALGYSIKVPNGLKGMIVDLAGIPLSRDAPGERPQHGLRILLPSGGEVVVLGEANSFLWKNPTEGVRSALADEACASGMHDVSPTRVGRSLTGSKGRLVCGERVLKLLLTFRTGGAPIYWFRLETVRAHELDDTAILENIAASFRLIRWR